MSKSITRTLRSQSGVGLIEVLVGAAIIGVTLPFAAANFTQNVRAIDSNRVAGAIDQLDEELATNIATKMHAFLRASALASSNFCQSGSGKNLQVDQLGTTRLASQYFEDLIASAGTQNVDVRQLHYDNLNAVLARGVFSKDNFKMNSTANRPGAQSRAAAVQRCLPAAATQQPVGGTGITPQTGAISQQSIYQTQPKDFRNTAGLYFCTLVAPKANVQGGTRNSLESMNLFGEFLFVMRDPAGNRNPQLNAPGSVLPAGNGDDIETCAGLRNNIGPKVAPPGPAPQYGLARLGMLYYTLYWVADEGQGNTSYREYSGSILINDKSVIQ